MKPKPTSRLTLLLVLSLCILPATSFPPYCDAPTPFSPIPDLSSAQHADALNTTTSRIISGLENLIHNDPRFDTVHMSIAFTSLTSTLHSYHHTAAIPSSLHPGATKITNTTSYRIASMTKPFTVLALLQLAAAGKLSLSDTLLDHLPHLNTTSSLLPWKDITLHALATQSAGIPRDFAQSDMGNTPLWASKFGLPPISSPRLQNDTAALPHCDESTNYTVSCTAADLLDWVVRIPPTFAPNQATTYSNIGFDLLGLVIATVANTSYETYIESQIIQPLNFTPYTTFSTPPDSHAAIAKDHESYWGFAMGVQNPTGGLYSNTADLSAWLRYILATYNAQLTGVNWLAPAMWSGSVNTFYGMPWEIYQARTSEVLGGKGSSRAMTFVTKGGGLPGYSSEVAMVPELGLGIVLLVAGDPAVFKDVRDAVVGEIVEFAVGAAGREVGERVGVYVDNGEELVARDNGSRFEIGFTEEDGLLVKEWRMNGKDVIAAFRDIFKVGEGIEMVVHLVPTLLFKDEEKKEGEIWRMVYRAVRRGKENGSTTAWDNFCVRDIDVIQYVGKPMNEIAFWNGGKVEFTGYRQTLSRIEDKDGMMTTPYLVEQV